MAQFSKVSFWGWRFWNEDQLCGFYKLRSLLFGWQSLNSNPRLQSIRTYQHPILERIFIWTKERTWFEHLWKMSGSTFPPKLGQFIPKIAQFGRRVPWFFPWEIPWNTWGRPFALGKGICSGAACKSKGEGSISRGLKRHQLLLGFSGLQKSKSEGQRKKECRTRLYRFEDLPVFRHSVGVLWSSVFLNLLALTTNQPQTPQ